MRKTNCHAGITIKDILNCIRKYVTTALVFYGFPFGKVFDYFQSPKYKLRGLSATFNNQLNSFKFLWCKRLEYNLINTRETYFITNRMITK